MPVDRWDILDTVGELTVAQLSKLAVWRCSVESQDRILGYIAGFRIRQQYHSCPASLGKAEEIPGNYWNETSRYGLREHRMADQEIRLTSFTHGAG
jgi:hypothetical protein